MTDENKKQLSLCLKINFQKKKKKDDGTFILASYYYK